MARFFWQGLLSPAILLIIVVPDPHLCAPTTKLTLTVQHPFNSIHPLAETELRSPISEGWDLLTTLLPFSPDGKIVAVGEYGCPLNYYGCLINGGGYKFSLVRFNNNGSLDTTFGTNGLSITNLSDLSDAEFYTPSRSDKLLAIQPDGKLVVAGNTSNDHFFVARFNSNGSLDPTFGFAGEIITPFGTSDDVRAVALQPDGKIIAAGSTSNGTNTGIALARYIAGTITPVSAIFTSQSANDGTILESYQNSGIGGTQNGFATTINVGDDSSNRQYRGILSFHTGSIPNNAVITSAQLKIRLQGVVGTDPFTSGFGNLMVDIHSGYFGNSIGLELADFSSPASPSTYQEHISTITYNWYGVNLSTANLGLIRPNGWNSIPSALRSGCQQ